MYLAVFLSCYNLNQSVLMLTITIPVFNVAEYLDNCLYSVVGQTYRDIEIILVDDGSTDGSEKICDEWGKRDERIKVIHQQNMGLYMARKTGAENAKGEYVLSIDADDWIDKDACEQIFTTIKNTSADVIQYGLQVEYKGQGNSEALFYDKWFNVHTDHIDGSDEMLISCYVRKNIPWNVATKAIRTDILNKAYKYIGEHKINQLEDFLTTYCVFLYSHTWHRLEGKFYHYQLGIGMSTNSKPMSLEMLNRTQGYLTAFKGLVKQVTSDYAKDTVAYNVLVNEMCVYVYAERHAQLQRNKLYPMCTPSTYAGISTYDANISSATNFEYIIQKTVAVHLHIFSNKALEEYRKYLKNISVPFDLYISVSCMLRKERDRIRDFFSSIDSVKDIRVERTLCCRNDIVPIFCSFKEEIMNHEIVLHMHTKVFSGQPLLDLQGIKTLMLMLSEDANMIILPKYMRKQEGALHTFWARTKFLKPILDISISYKDLLGIYFNISNRFEYLLEDLLFHNNNNEGKIYVAHSSQNELQDASS